MSPVPSLPDVFARIRHYKPFYLEASSTVLFACWSRLAIAMKRSIHSAWQAASQILGVLVTAGLLGTSFEERSVLNGFVGAPLKSIGERRPILIY